MRLEFINGQMTYCLSKDKFIKLFKYRNGLTLVSPRLFYHLPDKIKYCDVEYHIKDLTKEYFADNPQWTHDLLKMTVAVINDK